MNKASLFITINYDVKLVKNVGKDHTKEQFRETLPTRNLIQNC